MTEIDQVKQLDAMGVILRVLFFIPNHPLCGQAFDG